MCLKEFQEFQQRVNNLYIIHPEIERIWKLLDTRRQYRKISQDTLETPVNLFVMGKSRVGKSLMMKKYVESTKHYTEILEDGTEIDVIPVAYMDLPTPFTVAGLYNQIIERALKAPRLSSSARVEQLKSRAFSLLKQQKVEMLIIDELDYLLTSRYVNKRQAMEQIKNITNETGVILVCVGTLDIEELRKLSDQFIGRFPPTVVPWFKEYDEKFLDLLRSIENDIQSPVPLGFSDSNTVMPKVLHHLSGGLVGWLKPIIRESFRIVGVFEKNFNDYSILNKINGKVLLEARNNVVGELLEDEINNFLER